MRSRTRFFWLVSLMLLAPAASAQAPAGGGADPTAVAKEWANKAHERFEAGDYQGALDAMMEAQKHARPPTFVRFLAQVHEKLGKLLEAQRLYREVAETPLQPGAPAPFKKAQAEAKKDLASITKRIPRLVLTVTGADQVNRSVYIDGKAHSSDDLARGVPLDPGKRSLVVEAAGRDRVTRDVVLEEGATEKVNIDVPPPRSPQPTTALSVSPPPTTTARAGLPGSTSPLGPSAHSSAAPSPPPPMWLSVGKFAALGLGVAGLTVGAVTAGLVLGEVETLRSGPCSPDLERCNESDKEGVEEVRTLANVSTAGFVAGGVLAAAGIILLVLPPPGKKNTPSVGVAVNGAGLAVVGGF